MVLCMCLGWYQPDYVVWAASGSTSVSVSGSSVNIGDTVTVSARASGPSGEQAVATMMLSWDSSILQFVSCSTTYGGGGNSVQVATDSFTVTLKAVSAGTSSISLSGTDGVSYDDAVGELDAMSGSSASVTVNNAASEEGGTGSNPGDGSGAGTGEGSNGAGTGGSTNGGESTGGNTGTGGGTGLEEPSATEQKSADNSLKSLTISPGTLSPAFSGKTTTYSATVSNDVTSIAVSATPANAKAVVESVTGNENLKEGSNAIKIVVKAENGVTATYTVNVTRQSGSTDTPKESEKEEEPEEPETTAETITVDGVSYQIAENFAAEDIPTNFTENTINYHGNAYKGVSYNNGTLNMLWLVPAGMEEAGGKFFIYDEARDVVYPFVKLGNGEKYVIALLAPVDFAVPENYLQTSLMVDGENSITAYQRTSEEESEIASDFYVFYAVNYEGTEGWYQYDALEGTYQRFGMALAEEETAASGSDMEYLQEEYLELSEKYTQEKAFARNVIAILVFVIAILLIIIVNLLLHRFRKNDDDDDDFDDNDSFDGEIPEDDFMAPYDRSDTESVADGETLPEEEEALPEEDREQAEKGKKKRQRRKKFFSGDLEEDEFSEDAKAFENEVTEKPAEKKKEEKNDGDFEVIDFNDL